MTTFKLKMIALFFMLLDHIGLYFEAMPPFFRILGRAAYPLFLFCMVWGYKYTKNRKAYLLRLYLAGVFMSAFMLFIKWYLTPAGSLGYGNHNIFVPMLLTGYLISLFETVQTDRKKGVKMLAALFAVQLAYHIVPSFFPVLKTLSGDVLTGFIPNLFLNEYGFPFIALGVAMYFAKEQREVFTAVYLLFCIVQLETDFFEYGEPFQSLMVFALPFMLCYNRQKGPGLKYFFYVFYPAHTFILFLMRNYLIT